MKFAVPICTAVAPANKNSTASVAFIIPPNPIIGTLTAFATCHTIRKAIGFTQAPDNPQVTVDKIGLRRSASIAIPNNVLMRDTLSPPSASTALAISAISVTLGDNLTIKVPG